MVRFDRMIRTLYNNFMTTKKEQILALRAEGKTYNEIAAITGAAKSTVSYHCGDGQHEMSRKRQARLRASNPMMKRLELYKARKRGSGKTRSMNTKRVTYSKVWRFQKALEGSDLKFTFKDVLEKYGSTSECYLTGRPVDFTDSNTYQFDHIQPVSKGGDNSLENLGIASPEANYAKGDLTVEEFVTLCYDVVEHFERVMEELEEQDN